MSAYRYRRFLLTIIVASATCAAPAIALTAAEEEWVKLQNDGTLALDTNKYWIAEPLLKRALVKAGGFGENDLRLAKSLGELGRLYTIRGRFDEAEPYLEEELHVRELALGKTDGQTIPAMGSLIQFYLAHGTKSKADPLAEEMLAYVEGRLQEVSNQNRGKMKLQKGVALEGWAGEAAESMRNPIIDWAITCDAVGNSYHDEGKYAMAERLYKAALDVKSTVLGKQHLSLANSYDSLGKLAMSRNDYADAEGYFKDSLTHTERILPADNPQVYGRLDQLGKCLIKTGKFKEAQELYVRALGFWKHDSGKNFNESRNLFALGCLYCDEKNYSAAAPVLAHALRLAEEINGPASVSLVPYLQKYAYALYYLGRRPETEHLRARANEITGPVTQ